MFTIVSWYTLNTVYEEIINNNLLPSLDKLNLISKIYAVPSTGNWIKNTRLKSQITKRALEEINNDIVILDADCKVHEYPNLFDNIPLEYDIGCFYLDWKSWYRHSINKKELCSGTLFFRNTETTKKLIDRWIFYCSRNQYNDQQNLEVALKDIPEIKIYRLPVEYCWISTLPSGAKPFYPRPKNIIIEHFQASRKIMKNQGRILK